MPRMFSISSIEGKDILRILFRVCFISLLSIVRRVIRKQKRFWRRWINRLSKTWRV